MGKNVQEIKCLKCHKEIRKLVNLKRGFHSNKEVTSKKCWNCHGEHFGRNFEIIRFDEKKFNHKKSGYELIGSHKNLDCKKCHNSNFISDKKLKSKTKTFLGLNKNCITCHDDIHKGTLNNDCAKCHTMNKFTPAENFNHNDAKFVLTGKHKKVDCVKCHVIEKKGKEKFQKFTGLKFNNCNSCHKDVHKRRFGNDCKSCHNTESFNKISMTKNFNHNRTNFPLVGKHKSVSCKSCHKSSLSYKQKHKKCLDCHKDYHGGEFSSSGKPSDCVECHNEYGFSPSTYSVAEHNKSNFPLGGAHKAVACIECHLNNGKWKFRINGETCIACHKNVHGNSIDKKYFNKNKCEACHSTSSWKNVTFNHANTKFELIGVHKKTECASCHFDKSVLDEKAKHFITINSKCSSCHDDVHRGQFVKENEGNCKSCHNFNNWNPVLFDHNKTNFKIEGAHKNVDCLECHKLVNDKKGNYVLYKIEDTRCISCH